MLTLSFDNGPDPVVTPHVLRELAARDLTATFFVVGERLEDPASSALLPEIRSAGHAIGNHTYSHPRPFGALSPADAIREIERTDQLIGDYASPGRLFRPSAGGGVLAPGVLNRGVVDYLQATKRTLALWTLVCEDWRRPDGSWIDIAIGGMEQGDWTLLVLHDVASGAMDHLGRFLDRVLDAGLLVTADLPSAAVPIQDGEITGAVDRLLRAETGAAD